jgi:hypothetical protein
MEPKVSVYLKEKTVFEPTLGTGELRLKKKEPDLACQQIDYSVQEVGA